MDKRKELTKTVPGIMNLKCAMKYVGMSGLANASNGFKTEAVAERLLQLGIPISV